jgi:phage-related protein
MAKKGPAKGPAKAPTAKSAAAPPPAPDYSGATDTSKELLKNMQQLNAAQGKFNKSAQDTSKTLAENAKSKFWSVGKGALDGMVSGTKMLSKGITATLGPLAMMAKKFLSVTSIVSFITNAYQQGKEAAMKFSTQNTELARTMGLAQGEASKLAGEARSIGAEMGITNDQAVQAMGQIYSALGSTEKLSKNTLETFMKLSVFAGVSADTLAELAKTSKISGQDAGKFADAVADTSLSFIKANKMAVSMKSVMEGVSKVSASVKLTLGGSAEAITKAVLTSKKLGMELQKVEDIANGLLNLEDSIGAEMEAELLTGKDLNLEKAREAALSNDNVTLMEELAKNVGTQADFAKMNRVQQEATAKAVGMSREELAQTLANQKAVVAENGTLVDSQKDGTKAMESTASAAEQYQRRQEGIAAAFMGIFKALEPIVLAFQELSTKLAPPLAKLLSSLTPIIMPIVDLIGQLVEMFASILGELIPPIVSIIKVLVEAVKPLFQIFMDIMAVVLPPIKTLLEAIVPVIQNIFTALQPFFLAIGELAKTLIPIIAEILQAFLPIIQSIVEAIAPILTQFAELVTSLLPTVKEIFMALIPIIQLIIDAAKPFLQVFMDLLSAILPPIMDLIKGLVPIIQQIFEALKPAFDALAQLAQQLVPIIAQVLQSIIPVILKIVEALTPIFDIISELAQAFMPIILDVFNAIAPAIMAIMEALMPIIDVVMMIIKPILDILKPVLVVIGEILGFIIQAFAKIFEWVGKVAGFLADGILIAVDAISTAFSWMYDNVLAPIGDFFGMIYDFILGQIMSAVDDLGSAFSFIGDILSSVGDSITSVFVTAINWVIEAINWFIDGINSALTITVPDWMGGGSWSPDLPKLELIALAEGGIVSSPTTALIGEAGPEAVIPLDRFHDIMAEAFAPVVDLLKTMVEGNKIQTDTLVAINEKEATINLDGNKIGEALVTSFSGLF